MKRRQKPGADPQESLFGRKAQGRREGRKRATESGQLAEDKANRIRSAYSLLVEATILGLLAAKPPGGTITGEDVRAAAPIPEGADPRCIGPTFTRLRRAHRIVDMGFDTAVNPERHAGPVRRWALVPKVGRVARPGDLAATFGQVGPTVDDQVRDDLPPLDGFDIGGES